MTSIADDQDMQICVPKLLSNGIAEVIGERYRKMRPLSKYRLS